MASGTDEYEYDVIVVGAGPTGLTLARLLSISGVRVAIVDSHRLVTHHPRATHLDDETMRTLQTLGVADLEQEVLRMGGWVLLDPDGDPFISMSPADGKSDQGWNPDYQFHQPDFESRLRGLLAQGGVASFMGWTVSAVEDLGDRATVQIREQKSGASRSLSAAYVVGADGANSALRQQIARETEDLHGTQRSAIIDIYPFEHPAMLSRSVAFILCSRNKPVTYVPIGKPRLRFEFLLGAGEDANDYERPDTVYRLLSEWIDPVSYRIERADVYEWHAYLARGWRKGRLLIAGDAAHEMPPMLGQGMCSGIRDAANLAWKLALVVTHKAGDDLLDTYESERAAQVRPYIEESARQANMIEGFGYAENRPPAGGHLEMHPLRAPLGPGLADPATVSTLGPQPQTDDGLRVDDVIGYRFAVLAAPGVVNDVNDEVRAAWKELGATVITGNDESLTGWLNGQAADAVILRPDRYVYATTSGSQELSAATLRLLDRITSSSPLKV